MRWPKIGRQSRRGDSTANGPGAQDAPASSAAAPGSTTDRPWAALPPMAPSWAAETPLTAPAMAVIRQPLATLATEGRRQAGALPLDGAPEPGSVVGLAAVIVPKPADPTPAAELPAYFRDQPPLRHVTARPIVDHEPLVEATDAYVGEPVAPASSAGSTPLPTPQQPLRSVEPPVEAMTEAGARFREALANLHKSGLPRYEPGGESPAPPPAPPSGAPQRVPGTSSQPPLTHRRRTLAESRRLGLGAPIRPGAAEADEADEEGEPEGDPESSRVAPQSRASRPVAPVAELPPPAAPAAASAEPPHHHRGHANRCPPHRWSDRSRTAPRTRRLVRHRSCSGPRSGYAGPTRAHRPRDHHSTAW